MSGNITIGGDDLGTPDPWEAITTLRAEVNRLREQLETAQDDFLSERKQVVALRQVVTEMITCLNTADMSLLEADQVDEWRERAGIEEP